MSTKPSSVLFDAHLHADGLSQQDLRSMALFGVKGALVPARDAVCPSAKEFVAHFQELIHRQAQRLSRAGIRPYAALGVHPARVPWHGIEEILDSIPRLAVAGRLVAIGEIGLCDGGRREEQVFARQIELARELNLPVMAHTPERDKVKNTRRVCSILKESGIAEQAALVGHANEQTLKIIRECGFYVGLTVNPARLNAESVAAMVHSFGSECLVVSSDTGDGVNDILALPYTAMVLQDRGFSASILRRVFCDNALGFLRLERSNLGR